MFFVYWTAEFNFRVRPAALRMLQDILRLLPYQVLKICLIFLFKKISISLLLNLYLPCYTFLILTCTYFHSQTSSTWQGNPPFICFYFVQFTAVACATERKDDSFEGGRRLAFQILNLQTDKESIATPYIRKSAWLDLNLSLRPLLEIEKMAVFFSEHVSSIFAYPLFAIFVTSAI